ncbi:MAG: aspartate aminotransferase [Microcystis panniformis WG22]|nr:aspartate aminotransferase [Microcystis panniformis WG22]
MLNVSKLIFETLFSLSYLKQTKLYQEAIKKGREEGQQRGKLPAQLDYITLATALDLGRERGREVP